MKNINFDDITKQKIKEHNANWPQIADHPYRIWIIGGLDFEKNGLFNHTIQILRKLMLRIYIGPYQLLINKRGDVGLKH